MPNSCFLQHLNVKFCCFASFKGLWAEHLWLLTVGRTKQGIYNITLTLQWEFFPHFQTIYRLKNTNDRFIGSENNFSSIYSPNPNLNLVCSVTGTRLQTLKKRE